MFMQAEMRSDVMEFVKQTYVRCAVCGCKLYAKTAMLDGDDAWEILDNWYCDDCARAEFRREVETDDPDAI